MMPGGKGRAFRPVSPCSPPRLWRLSSTHIHYIYYMPLGMLHHFALPDSAGSSPTAAAGDEDVHKAIPLVSLRRRRRRRDSDNARPGNIFLLDIRFVCREPPYMTLRCSRSTPTDSRPLSGSRRWMLSTALMSVPATVRSKASPSRNQIVRN